MYHYRSNRLEAAENILFPILEKKAVLETLSETSLATLYQYVGMLKSKRKLYKEATTYFQKSDKKLTELYGREHWKAIISHSEYLHCKFISMLYVEEKSEEMPKLARGIQVYCDFLEEKDVQTSTATVYNAKTDTTEQKEIRYGNNLVISANNNRLIANIARLLKCDIKMLELQNETDYLNKIHPWLDLLNHYQERKRQILSTF